MENIYNAPKAELVEKLSSEHGAPFFVVSLRKVCLLFLLTFGWYSFYWSFKHWYTQRRSAGEPVTPLWRSIFYLFFTHSLFGLINKRLAARELPYWRYAAAPHVFVGLAVVIWLINLLAYGDERTMVVALLPVMALLIVRVLALMAIQRQANLASGDPSGASNSGLSGWTSVFIVVGAGYWALILLGAISILLGVTPR
ncbi:hypothetical protein [Pseudomonas sp. GV071]|uniref:hypothetical protein n=1 Tax=Pseudomonas sp. GV071 TaxID=2135754 RepID=UPI000D35A901|nr:hypothetical protein [Pseudomonas sp. GV071]PTQ70039.1 hypothetical protein C8K61_107255 [Pseudomonas sp. GV071]